MVKVLLVVTSHAVLGNTGKPTGYYLPEVTHPFFRLQDAGFTVDIASPKGGNAPMDASSRDKGDPDNRRFLEDPALMKKLEHTLPLAQIKSSDYQAVLFAGGHGTMWDFAQNTDLARISAEIYEHGGVVAAVCHGPAALINIKRSSGDYLVKGKRVTGFSNAEEEAAGLTQVMPFLLESKLVERGGIYEKAPLWQAKVVVSERLVTGQNPASAAGVGEAMVKLLR